MSSRAKTERRLATQLKRGPIRRRRRSIIRHVNRLAGVPFTPTLEPGSIRAAEFIRKRMETIITNARKNAAAKSVG